MSRFNLGEWYFLIGNEGLFDPRPKHKRAAFTENVGFL